MYAMNKFSKWCVRLGGVLVVYSALAYIVNFLPVDFWVTLSNFLSGEDSHTYYKVVATEGSQSYSLATLILGVCLIIAGKMYAKSNT